MKEKNIYIYVYESKRKKNRRKASKIKGRTTKRKREWIEVEKESERADDAKTYEDVKDFSSENFYLLFQQDRRKVVCLVTYQHLHYYDLHYTEKEARQHASLFLEPISI